MPTWAILNYQQLNVFELLKSCASPGPPRPPTSPMPGFLHNLRMASFIQMGTFFRWVDILQMVRLSVNTFSFACLCYVFHTFIYFALTSIDPGQDLYVKFHAMVGHPIGPLSSDSEEASSASSSDTDLLSDLEDLDVETRGYLHWLFVSQFRRLRLCR